MGVTPQLKWSAIEGVSTYSIHILDAETKEQVFIRWSREPSLTVTLPLPANKNYVWKVDAWSATGEPVGMSYTFDDDFGRFRTE